MGHARRYNVWRRDLSGGRGLLEWVVDDGDRGIREYWERVYWAEGG